MFKCLSKPSGASVAAPAAPPAFAPEDEYSYIPGAVPGAHPAVAGAFAPAHQPFTVSEAGTPSEPVVSSDDVFDRFDLNLNGALDDKDMKHMCHQLRIDVDEQYVSELISNFGRFDQNGSGEIDKTEFRGLWQLLVQGSAEVGQVERQEIAIAQSALGFGMDIAQNGTVLELLRGDVGEVLPAEHAGVQKWARVVELNGTPVRSKDDVTTLIGQSESSEFLFVFEIALRMDAEARKLNDLQQKFLAYDSNKDGILTPDDVQRMLSSLGYSEQDIASTGILDFLDEDTDGIDFLEFQQIWGLLVGPQTVGEVASNEVEAARAFTESVLKKPPTAVTQKQRSLMEDMQQRMHVDHQATTLTANDAALLSLPPLPSPPPAPLPPPSSPGVRVRAAIPGEDPLQALFVEHDANHDGFLDRGETESFLGSQGALTDSPEANMNLVLDIFYAFDADDDCQLSFAEFTKMCTHYGFGHQPLSGDGAQEETATPADLALPSSPSPAVTLAPAKSYSSVVSPLSTNTSRVASLSLQHRLPGHKAATVSVGERTESSTRAQTLYSRSPNRSTTASAALIRMVVVHNPKSTHFGRVGRVIRRTESNMFDIVTFEGSGVKGEAAIRPADLRPVADGVPDVRSIPPSIAQTRRQIGRSSSSSSSSQIGRSSSSLEASDATSRAVDAVKTLRSHDRADSTSDSISLRSVSRRPGPSLAPRTFVEATRRRVDIDGDCTHAGKSGTLVGTTSNSQYAFVQLDGHEAPVIVKNSSLRHDGDSSSTSGEHRRRDSVAYSMRSVSDASSIFPPPPSMISVAPDPEVFDGFGLGDTTPEASSRHGHGRSLSKNHSRGQDQSEGRSRSRSRSHHADQDSSTTTPRPREQASNVDRLVQGVSRIGTGRSALEKNVLRAQLLSELEEQREELLANGVSGVQLSSIGARIRELRAALGLTRAHADADTDTDTGMSTYTSRRKPPPLASLAGRAQLAGRPRHAAGARATLQRSRSANR